MYLHSGWTMLKHGLGREVTLLVDLKVGLATSAFRSHVSSITSVLLGLIQLPAKTVLV